MFVFFYSILLHVLVFLVSTHSSLYSIIWITLNIPLIALQTTGYSIIENKIFIEGFEYEMFNFGFDIKYFGFCR